MPHAIDDITDLIIGAAIRVHAKYGPGLLESVYNLALALELVALGLAQLLTYLRLLDIRVGLLINFNVTKLIHGVRRVVNRHVDDDGKPLPPPRKKESIDEVRKAADKENK